MIYFIDRISEISIANFKLTSNKIILNSIMLVYKDLKISKLTKEVMNKRVVFPRGKQKEFLVSSKKEINSTWAELAKKLDVKRGTLEKSYTFEFCNMPYTTFVNICKLRKISNNKTLKIYNAKVVNLIPVIGRKAFGETRTKLPPINITYTQSTVVFDLCSIKLNDQDKLKKLELPAKLTPELAEEIGLHCGDGFLSSKRYEYRLKGNKNEKEYYDLFIKNLYKKLFNVDIKLKEYETTYGFEFHSKSFWTFKHEILGLPSGKKDDMDFPNVIKVNDLQILTSFIRGLFDTDGSVSFVKKYKELGDYYPIISLTLKPKKLLMGTAEILSMLGLEPRVTCNGDYWVISLNGYKRLANYLKLIGFSNKKSIDKIKKWKKQYPELGKDIMADVVQPG